MFALSGRTVAGAFAILLGAMLLLRELGFVELDAITKFWPVALIVIGVVLMFGWSRN